ncbi:hypothetical protein AB0J38_06160 [Streptomyces sp. NPDC050095]|uniref:hypothetical protein n=1 Tax=unclassified Streptomyces TaxID=2593676 RepID=UPI0034227905
MILSSEDAGVWLVPVVFVLGLAVVSPIACVVLLARLVLRIARAAAVGHPWSAFTPGTWLLAAGAGAFGATCRFSVLLYDRSSSWADSVSFVCACFALAALSMAALTAMLNDRLQDRS